MTKKYLRTSGIAADRWLSTLTAQEQRALDIIQHLEAMIQKRGRSKA